jgi:integrase
MHLFCGTSAAPDKIKDEQKMTQIINFTKETLNSLRVPLKGRAYYKDLKEKGLSLYITSTRHITFFVRKRVHCKDERLVLGTFPEISIENARKKAIQIKAVVAQGQNPNQEKLKLNKDMTFHEMFTQFMERYSKVSKRSWIYDEREVNKFLSHWFKRKSLTISKQEIQLLHEKIRTDNGLYQANRLLERIRVIYNKNIEWGWAGTNPTQGIKKFKEKSRDRFLQANELPCLFEALSEEENIVARDYILISLLTGARKSNGLSMRWHDINLEAKVWRIPETKNGDSLTIPLTDQAIEILLQRKVLNKYLAENNDQYVFPGTGKEGYLADPKKAWRRIRMSATMKLWRLDDTLAEALKIKTPEYYSISELFRAIVKNAKSKKIELSTGLMDVHIHDLRRTLGSWQAATGATTAIIGKSLGHKSQQATAVYERLNIDPVRASLERATEAMFGNFKIQSNNSHQ